MKNALIVFLLACVVTPFTAPALAENLAFSFGVIANDFKSGAGESSLRKSISEADDDNLAFVLVNGIKSGKEACSDDLYIERKALLSTSKNGLILSLAADDWANCTRGNGRSAAVERLGRIRELFYSERFSFGDSKLPLIRQSITPQFRSYGENMRWRVGEVLFATLNLPANNNNYIAAAGRNSEFEDRMIANREWLEKIFMFANREKLTGVVLFTDGDPLHIPSDDAIAKLSGKRDGYAEARQLISSEAKKFSGSVLMVHDRQTAKRNQAGKISWRDNIGKISVDSGWLKVNVDESKPRLFSTRNYSEPVAEAR